MDPVALHLFHVDKDGTKRLHIPRGREGDIFLADFVESTFEQDKDNVMIFKSDDVLLEEVSDTVSNIFDILKPCERLHSIIRQVKDRRIAARLVEIKQVKENVQELKKVKEDMRKLINHQSQMNDRLEENEEHVEGLATSEEAKEELTNRQYYMHQEMTQSASRQNDTSARVVDLERRLSSTSIAQVAGRLFSAPAEPTPPCQAKKIPTNVTEQEEIRKFVENSTKFNFPLSQLADEALEIQTEEQSRWITTLVQALEKLPNHQGISYRGTEMPQNWIDVVILILESGDDFHFTSPTFTRSTKYHSKLTKKGGVFHKNARYIIDGTTGKEYHAVPLAE
eukprot:scaffold1221_cov207-Amphora_coffeaeformis.AAC.9